MISSNGLADLVADGDGTRQVCVWQDNREFFATVASHQISALDASDQDPRYSFEDLIADLMPIGVIE